MLQRILLVDDEPLARERLAALVRAHAPDAAIKEAGDGEAAVEAILGWAPDLVLLDIQMPGASGVEVVERVGAARMPLTIFVTAHDEFAVRAFELAAMDYLLKPFDDARFAAAFRRAVERHVAGAVVEQAKRLAALAAGADAEAAPAEASPRAAAVRAGRYLDRLVVKTGLRTFVVMLADVQWIESDGNYVVLHAGKEKHTVRETLTAIESRLDPSHWVRIHRRILVDLRAMRELQPWFGGDQVMILRDGTQLRVSRTLRTHVAERLAGAP